MRKILIFLLSFSIIAVLVVGLLFRQWIWGANVKKNLTKTEFKIPTGSNYNDVLHLLKKKKILYNYASFDFIAGVMKYKKNKVAPGRYILKQGMSNRELISMLRAGLQTPLNITFNNVRTVEELVGRISHYIEADSMKIVDLLHDSAYIADLGYNKYNILTMFIPNTYQFFWNTDPKDFLNRMKREHDKFWTKERLEKAKKIGLTPEEVFTLASIVEKETLAKEEKPVIASVYLNRLKRDMLLQADPTVVYAAKDFGIQRVLNKHLKIDSPYNTYKNKGLPPGPICMPDVGTIDSVLNAKDTDYLFFCAKPNGHGRHAFAKTNRQHVNNANRYRKWLNKNKIR